MKFTKEQARQVLYMYDANLDNVRKCPTRVDTMLHALNEVAGTTPAGDALTATQRAYITKVKNGRVIPSLLELMEIIDQLAPAPAPKTPGQVAYEASCYGPCWAAEDPADRARWEAIAQAVLAAAQADSQ